MIKILIVDDHEIIREGLKRILKCESDLCVVGEAQNGEEAIELITNIECDVVVLDMNMPGRCGVELLTDIKALYPELHVLVLTIHPEDKFALSVLKAGASGYLCKDAALDELVNAIRKVHEKGRYISSTLAEQLAFNIFIDSGLHFDEQLSVREKAILSKIATGSKVKDIARELGLSVSTIFTYRMKIFEKISVKNNVELARYAIDNKMLNI